MARELQIPQLLNIEEAAGFLDWTPNYLRRLARQARVPAHKVGREWRFYLTQLEEWIAQDCPSQEEQPSLFERTATPS